VDPALILAVIAVESDFEPRAVSPKGAVGLMQLMPHTGEIFGASIRQLFDPGMNILAGTRFLAECLERFMDERLALAAYNAGPSRVALYQAIPPIRETRLYVAKVLRLRQGYRTMLGN
jgi:soluble lytic murein transglycosylase-like protein